MTFENFLLPALVFVAVASVGSAVIALLRSRRPAVQRRLQSVSDVLVAENEPNWARAVGRVGEITALSRPSSGLKEQLAKAGFFHRSAGSIYLGVKALCFIFGLVLSVVAAVLLDLPVAAEAYIAAMIPVVTYFTPNLVVRARRNARCAQVRQHLPDVVDLLEICVSAGMGLDAAWSAVADEIRGVSPVLGDEMSLTMLEMQLGASRTVAMRHMAERTGATELRSLVALLIQSDRFGTSLADALRTFARSMRETRSHRAEETAEKTAVRLLFPLVFFIFPVMLIVIAGPAALTLYRLINQ
jgi:tight adherence protein C